MTVMEVELPEARAGDDHPVQHNVSEDDGLEVEHLERGDGGIIGSREVAIGTRAAGSPRGTT